MSKFRMVQTHFWSDAKVAEELTPEDKYFFLYLLTNDMTTQTGIYQITRRKMAYDLGYSLETVNALLERFTDHLEMVRYNMETRELAIQNWGRYNLRRAGKPLMSCVTEELKTVKDRSLINYVGERIENKTIKSLYLSLEDVDLEEEEEANDGRVKEPEEEEEVQGLFDHYITKNIILHKKMTAAMKRAIKERLKDYTFEELKNAIDNYATVYFSEQHWFTHKYPLADFMRDKDIRKFLDEADPVENYRDKQSRKRVGIRKEDFDLS